MSNKILELKNVYSGYNNNIIILHDICLDIYKGEFIAILGPNGAGKTTLIKTIMNLCGPCSGNIFIKDKNINSLTQKQIAQKITVIPQGLSVPFAFTVYEFISLARFPHRNNFLSPNNKDKTIINNTMALMNIEKLKNRAINTLSAGEFQRTLIAQGLIQEPELLILDEPVAHLDIKYKYEILDILKNLNKKGLTIISVMHDINLANRYCSREIFFKQGKIVLQGHPKNVCTNENLEFIYDISVNINYNTHNEIPYVYR
ncbi:ABC transporter ATP-binding protein [bacterium]